jgi:hypothetical protein
MSQLPWYDSLDPKFSKRLLRPSVQPGVIDRRLVNSISARPQWLNSRLSLLNHLTSRQSRETIQAGSVPIVCAQPVSQPAGTTSLIASPSASPLSTTSSMPLLAPGNNASPTPLPANQRTIVQAKFIDSTGPSQFNPTSLSNSTSVFSNSTSERSSVKQQSVSQALTDLPLTYPLLNGSPDIQQNTQLIQQTIPAIAINQRDLANTSATDSPTIGIQHPQSVTTINPDVTTDRRRSQRVDRIPPLPPLHRLPNSMEASSSAETTLPVQIQRKLDREPITSQSMRTPQIDSGPVSLVYAQSMQQESKQSSLPNSQPSLATVVQPLDLQPLGVQPIVQVSGNRNVHPKAQSRQWQDGQQVPLVYSHAPVAASSSEREVPDSAPSRAITDFHLTPNSTQANSFERRQEFNRASTVTNEQSASHQQSVTPQQPAIDIGALTEKIQRKLLRQLTVESERRGHSSWR